MVNIFRQNIPALLVCCKYYFFNLVFRASCVPVLWLFIRYLVNNLEGCLERSDFYIIYVYPGKYRGCYGRRKYRVARFLFYLAFDIYPSVVL